MRFDRIHFPSVLVALLAWGTGAWASAGRVTALEGDALRTPAGGIEVALGRGSDIEVGDRLRVGPTGNLGVTWNDGSKTFLSAGSVLEVNEADFPDGTARRWSARLVLGTLWARVTKVLSGDAGKFEVVTDQCVAGVRGTEFHVSVPEGAGAQITVGVLEGRVAVGRAGLGEELVGAGEGLVARAEGFQRSARASVGAAMERFVERHVRDRYLTPSERRERREDRRERRRLFR